MHRDQALEILARCKPVLQERYQLSALSLFGSTARNEANDDSDIDILVDFDSTPTSEQFYGVQFYLEDMLPGLTIDLVTRRSVRRELVPYINQDRIDI